MSTSKRSIFRDNAIKQYIQGRDKDILPRFVSPSGFIFLWIFLGFCIATGLLAWNTQVPVYTHGIGTIVEGYQSGQTIAVIFLAPDQLHHVHPGQPIQVRIGSVGPELKQTVTFVEPNILSPSEARKRYRLEGPLSLVITQPSVVIRVALNSSISSRTYAGSMVHADVQLGLQRVLSMLPIVGNLIGA